jgi:arabinogalactan oligomer/maltooligosaccharide transport system substrate-binding protein
MKLGRIAAAVIASAALLGSTLTVVSPASAVENIVVWADKGTLDTIKTRVNAWNAANAGYTVTLVQKDFSTVRDALKVAVPKGQGPDILAGAAHDWVGNLVKANVLKPITLPSNFKDDFVNGALQALKFNGQYYGVPGWTENIAFLRNVKKQKTRITSINQVKNGEIGINYSATTSDPYHFYPFQTMFNAPIFKTDSSGDWTNTVGMGGSNGSSFAKWMKSKGTGFFGKPADAKILCNFLNGKIKYWVTGAWNINSIEAGAAGCKTGLKIGSGYSIDPFPKGPTGITPKQFLGIRGHLMVADGPNNKTNVAGATDLLRWLSSEASQFSIYDNFNKTPANKAALNRAKDNPVIKGFADAGVNAVPMPNSPAMDAAWVTWGKAQTRIIQGKESKPDVAWANMVKALQATINKLT